LGLRNLFVSRSLRRENGSNAGWTTHCTRDSRSLLRTSATSLEDYIRFYTESWLKLQKTSPELLSYEDRTLYSTWNLSFEHVKRKDVSAAQLLRLLAYFDSQDIWYQLLAVGKRGEPKWFAVVVQDELSFNNAIRLLCDHGLVEPSGGLSKGYGMHSCVHHWSKFVLGGDDDAEMGRIVLSCVGASIPTDEDPRSRAIQRRLLPHARKCIEVVQNDLDRSSENRQEYLHEVSLLGWLFFN
jgi:hypothetical protein